MGKYDLELTPDVEDLSKRKINWFPGHMNKALKKILDGVKSVDIILELRDARSPLATANRALQSKIGDKARLVVINKTNLADPIVLAQWEEWFKTQKDPYIFTNCLDTNSLKKVVTLAKEVLAQKRGENAGKKTKIKMMLVGLPNTGKSTIINQLSNRNATKVAPKPGHTRNQLWVKVDSEMDLLDTPGVMPPQIEKYEHGLWLSALHAIPDHIVSPETSACFLVEHFLETKSENFKNLYKLDSLDGDLIDTLNEVAKNRGCIKRKNEYDYDRVYNLIINDFRKGTLGKISFGVPPKLRKS